MLRQLLASSWNTLHPEIEDGDAEFRATPLAWLGSLSQLSFNHHSLVEDGREALREILLVYESASFSHLQKQIAGIPALSLKRECARLISENGDTFARGEPIDLEVDEEQVVSAGAYQFVAVIERFLPL